MHARGLQRVGANFLGKTGNNNNDDNNNNNKSL